MASICSLLQVMATAQSTPPPGTYGDLELEKRTLDDIYSLVDKTKIPSGFLVNRGFDRTNTATITDIRSMADVDQFYFNLQKSYVGSGVNPVRSYLKWQDTIAYYNANRGKEPGRVGLAIFTVDMHAINSEAVTSGNVYLNSDKRLVVTNPATAYTSLPLCTMVPTKFNLTGPDVTFDFESYMAVRNTTSITFQIDFDNGYGFKTLSGIGSYGFTYATPGIKTIRVKYMKGDELGESTFQINVTFPPNNLRTINWYSDKFTVKTNRPKKHSAAELLESWPNANKIQYMFPETGADVYEFLGCDGKKDKYCILVEGLDANNEYGPHDALANGFTSTPVLTMFHQMLNAGYEVVFVDFHAGGDYIENNAAVLQKVIEEINIRKGSNTPNVVVGVSMGGLIVRYALRDMELKGLDHQTGLATYFDAPHWGANIPVGYQTMTNALLAVPSILDKMTWGAISYLEQVRFVNHTLSCPASKQMLYRYLGANPHTSFGILQQKLAEQGLPRNCRNVSVVNGSNNGTDQGYAPGANLFNKSTGIGLLFDVWATANGGNNTVSRIKWRKEISIDVSISGCRKILGHNTCIVISKSWDIKLIDTDLYSYTNYFDKCYDNAPGSTFDGVSNGMRDVLGGTFPTNTPHFAFMPSVTAAYLKPPYVSNLYTSLLDVNTTGKSYMDFVYTYSNANGRHIFDQSNALNNTVLTWINNDVMPFNLVIQNKTFTANRDFNAINSITTQSSGFAPLPSGPVVFEKGQYTLIAGSRIRLRAGTRIKAGVTFRAYVNPGLATANNNCTISYRTEEADAQISDGISEGWAADAGKTDVATTETMAYPNPLTGGMLHFGRNANRYLLMNGNGGVVLQGDHADKVDVSSLAKGMYILQVDGKNEKIVIE